MNTLKILNRGHQSLVDVLKDLPDQNVDQGFVTGSWTVRDIIDHLGIYEDLQLEAFRKFLDPAAATPLLDEKAKGSFSEFNQKQWERDRRQDWKEIFGRYAAAHAGLKEMVEKIPSELLAKQNTSQWYGEGCSLEDIIALNFGHKKHHTAQIKLFRQRNKI